MTRPLGQPDLAAVGRLLDATLGPGYWSLDPSCVGALRVAEADGAIVGLASACITESAPYVDGVGPVGLVREVAVDPGYRGRGVATRLVREVCAECARAGAATLATYAWVYAREGRAPLAGVLERLGFERRRGSRTSTVASPTTFRAPGAVSYGASAAQTCTREEQTGC